MILPHQAHSLLLALSPAFTTPSFHRFTTLMAAAILTTERRTVANLLRTLGGLAPGHRTSYQRLLSAAQGFGLHLACRLTRFLLQHLLPEGTVRLVGDDIVDGHKGKKVHGKARHRDPVRSTKSYTAWRYGHKGGVLAVLVSLPFASCPWALPVLVDLYYSEEGNRQRHRPHRTPAQLMCRLLRLMLRWFPQTRGWCRNTVLRAAPCLFGLYTVVALLYTALPECKRELLVLWPGKETATFSDALTAVRRWLWSQGVFPQADGGLAIEKLPGPTREIILSALAPAA